MSQLTNLFLVRHGQTQWNLDKRYQGQLDSPLTALGISQAINLQGLCLNKNIDIAYSSPLLRALETAYLILKNIPITLLICPRLSEMHLGSWQGKTPNIIRQNYPQEFFCFLNDPHKYYLQGAESFIDLQKRAIFEIKQIFNRNQGKNILVISHGLVIKVILSYFSSNTRATLAGVKVPENGSYITLQKSNGQILLI